MFFASYVAGCQRNDTATTKVSARTTASTPSAHAVAPSAAPSLAVAASAPAAGAADREHSQRDGSAVKGSEHAFLVSDELSDVGPAGPATAAAVGVVMLTRNDEILLAALSAASARRSRGFAVIAEPVSQPAQAFGAPSRGPAVERDTAYWVSKGRLLRRKLLGNGAPEVLADGAQNGSRVSALAAHGTVPTAVAYLGHGPDGNPQARLWLEGQTPLPLSPEGSTASSVVLVPGGNGLIALSLEGRSAMSPLHARRILFTPKGPKLEEDAVVWVGGSAQPLTEVSASGAPAGQVWAFIPLERDATRFGLARIPVGPKLASNVDASWFDYPNGLDPAPLATGLVCGVPAVVYVRPAEARPGSPQELHLRMQAAIPAAPTEIVARARSFMDVSMATIDGGVLIAYVADHRTWARGIRCASQNK